MWTLPGRKPYMWSSSFSITTTVPNFRPISQIVIEFWKRYHQKTSKNYSGVQSINNVYAIVNKVENVLVNTYILDLIDNGVYVVYALYSSIVYKSKFLMKQV